MLEMAKMCCNGRRLVWLTRCKLGSLPLANILIWTHTPYRQYAKKAKKKGGGSSLSEEEREVIDLGRVEAAMQAAITALKWEYSNTLVTRLTPASLDKLHVDVNGENVPLRQLGQVGMPNANTLILNMTSYPQAIEAAVSGIRAHTLNLNPHPIQAIEAAAIEAAVSALRSHTLNLNPTVESNIIKVPIPKMSKELREKMVKEAKVHAEKAKVGVRKARQKAISDVRKESGSEDTTRKLEKHIQQLTDTNTESIEELLKAKSKDLLKTS